MSELDDIATAAVSEGTAAQLGDLMEAREILREMDAACKAGKALEWTAMWLRNVKGGMDPLLASRQAATEFNT